MRRKTKIKIKKIWKKLNEGIVGDIFYSILGIVLAYVFYKVILAYILCTPVPIVAVISSSMQHDNPEETFYGWLEKNLGYNRSYIESWPFQNGINVGDMPIVYGCGDYNIGDVIVYKVPGQPAPIIHRIIKINPDNTFQTKGDNNLGQLPYELSVKKDQIYGKVIFIIPKLGYVKLLITRIFGVM